MKKNLSNLFPEIFGQGLNVMKDWENYENKMKILKESLDASKNSVRNHIKNKILENVTDPLLKKILLQPIVERAGAKSERCVIEGLIEIHMNDNGPIGYKNARMADQIHLMNIFPGIEDLFEKKFYIKELNAEIWFRPRPHDTENVILTVAEIEEVSV